MEFAFCFCCFFYFFFLLSWYLSSSFLFLFFSFFGAGGQRVTLKLAWGPSNSSPWNLHFVFAVFSIFFFLLSWYLSSSFLFLFLFWVVIHCGIFTDTVLACVGCFFFYFFFCFWFWKLHISRWDTNNSWFQKCWGPENVNSFIGVEVLE